MKSIVPLAELIGRVFIAGIFLTAGIEEISGFEGTQGYMDTMGVPSFLLPLVIVTEICGAIAVILGFKTRIAAFLLAGFSVISAILFHLDFSNSIQAIMFMKNIAIAGGFLFLLVHGAGKFSIDNKLRVS